MAEYIMKDMVQQAGATNCFYIESAATSTEEAANPVYPPARRKLAEHGIRCDAHAARQMARSDYDRFDLIVCMDRSNVRGVMRIVGGDPAGKVCLLLDYADRAPGSEVADPWYTGDFDATWRDCVEGCRGILASLMPA